MTSEIKQRLKSHVDHLCLNERFPHSRGYYNSQEYIEDQVRSMGAEVQRQDFRDLPIGRCRNIYAETGPASGPRTLIGAHYDSLKKSGPAADDNASAVAICLELMRQLPKSRPYTFVFFDVEENYGFGGLHGSRAFANFYKQEISKVIVFDLAGGSLAPGFEDLYFQFGPALPKLQHPQLRFLHLPMLFLEPFGKIFARSDYSAFRNRGLAFSYFSTGTPWYYHTPHDTPEVLNFDKMALMTDALIRALAEKPLPQRLSPDWQDFKDFIDRIYKQPALRTKVVQKMISPDYVPSRWDIVKLYSQILPILRREKKQLWHS